MFAFWYLSTLMLFSLGCYVQGYTETEWLKLDRASQEHTLKLTFAIKRTNPQWLKEKIRAVSYPSSPQYGKYMNFDRIANHVYGTPESVDALLKTLTSIGVQERDVKFTIGRDFAIVPIKVVAAEKLLTTQFYSFRHTQHEEWTIVKAFNYTLPDTVKHHLDFVSGIAEFPRIRTKPSIVQVSDPVPDFVTTPKSINSAYKIGNYIASNPNNSQAVAGFLKQYFNEDDLAKFQKKYGVHKQKVAKIIGKNTPLLQGVEANLDVQYIMGVGQNVTTWFFSESQLANKNQEDFLSWIVANVNDTTSPWVHSVSYADYEHSIPLDYQTRCEDEFMKFGISGRTLLFAAGDEGVHCRKERYIPEWPPCSPYVTAVGGTEGKKEVWSQGGGGFSDVFPTPDYQKDVVELYLKSGKAPSEKLYNASGRAYPDVSAFAVGFEIIFADIDEQVAGTSCSTPTVAGIVSLLNDIRLNNGKKTLGFLNPLLYQQLKGKGFTDVTSGTNTGASTRGCKGFSAVGGWDPASGWGQPDFSMLKSLVLE